MISYSSFLRIDPLFGIAPFFIDFFFTSFIFPYFAYFGEVLSSLNKGKDGN